MSWWRFRWRLLLSGACYVPEFLLHTVLRMMDSCVAWVIHENISKAFNLGEESALKCDSIRLEWLDRAGYKGPGCSVWPLISLLLFEWMRVSCICFKLHLHHAMFHWPFSAMMVRGQSSRAALLRNAISLFFLQHADSRQSGQCARSLTRLSENYLRNVFKQERNLLLGNQMVNCTLICRMKSNLKSLCCMIKVNLPKHDVDLKKKKKKVTQCSSYVNGFCGLALHPSTWDLKRTV